LIQLAEQPISDLASYAAVLRGLKTGENVELQFRRNGEVKVVEVVEVTLVER